MPGTTMASITHDGRTREYLVHVPQSYTGSASVPLLLAFHGYTGDAASFIDYADFRPVSEAEGVLLVYPQGLGPPVHFTTFWDVDAEFHADGEADDVGFVDALLTELAGAYAIDTDRVYATGWSNGGAMSYRLACERSDRIAAIASVAGPMSQPVFASCAPGRPVPVFQIHGTADQAVDYQGDGDLLPVVDVFDWWSDSNGCGTAGAPAPLPDTDPGDGSTVDHIIDSDCDSGVTVELFRINGGGHPWPGTFGGNQDIDAVVAIWDFLDRFDRSGSR